MGWLIVVAAKPLWDSVGLAGVLWLAAGGLAYTLGVAFFAAPRVRFGHFVWHLFVLADVESAGLFQNAATDRAVTRFRTGEGISEFRQKP